MKIFIIFMQSFGIYDLELKGFNSWKGRETRFFEP